MSAGRSASSRSVRRTRCHSELVSVWILEARSEGSGPVQEEERSRETLLDPEATQSRFLVMAS